MFAKAVEPLLKVHRSAAQQAFGPSFGAAKARDLPTTTTAAQASPASTTADTSGSASVAAVSSVSETGYAAGVKPDIQREGLGCLPHELGRQMPPRAPPLNFNLGKAIGSSTPSTLRLCGQEAKR